MSPRRSQSVLQGLGLGSVLVAVAGALPIGASGAEAGAQNPAPVNAFELEAGRRFDLLPQGKDDSTFRLTYKGALVRSEGTSLKFSSGLDLGAFALPGGGVAAAGDRN